MLKQLPYARVVRAVSMAAGACKLTCALISSMRAPSASEPWKSAPARLKGSAEGNAALCELVVELRQLRA